MSGALVYGKELTFLHFLCAGLLILYQGLTMRFLMVTNRRVILTKTGFWLVEPTRVVKSVPRDQVKLEVIKAGKFFTKLRIHFPGTPQIRLRVFKRFVPAGVVEALLPKDESR
jgi:hypothetical protein